MTESAIQQQCYTYFHNHYPEYRGLLFHVPNNPKNAISGSILRAMGQYAGVADLIALSPTGGGITAIELKTDTGTQSEAQKQWQKQICKFHHNYVICRSFEEFQDVIEGIYGGAERK